MRHLVNPRRFSHRFLCALLALLMAASPAPLLAQAPDNTAPIDMSYALPNTCIVVALRPAQILKSPTAQMFPVEVLQAAAIQAVGLDPLAAEQLVVCVAPPTQGPPNYSVVARFSAPAELKAGEFTAHTQPASFNGTPYLQSMHPLLPSFFMADPQTLVATPDATLTQIVGAEGAVPPESLVSKFAAASQGDDLLVMIDVEPLRPLISMGLMQAEIPPEYAQLREIPSLIKTVQLRVNLTRPGMTEVIASANNDADALKLVRMFDSYKQMMADQVGAEAARMLASDDPVEQAGGRYIQRISKLTDEQMQLVYEGDQLVLVRTDLHTSGGGPMFSVATVGVLVALLLPAVQAAREAARRAQSMNNLKQIMLAMLNHHDARKWYPAHANYSDDGKPLLSWRVHILPFIEQQALYQQFHLDEPWDSPHNRELIPMMPAVYLDPSSGLATTDGKTHYLGPVGAGLLFDGTAEGREIRTITDGTSNTIAVIQVSDENAVEWTRPDDWEFDPNDPLAGIGSMRAGNIFLTGLCDGSVHAMSLDINPALFKSMLTVDGED
jgi:hypothetical protein